MGRRGSACSLSRGKVLGCWWIFHWTRKLPSAPRGNRSPGSLRNVTLGRAADSLSANEKRDWSGIFRVAGALAVGFFGLLAAVAGYRQVRRGGLGRAMDACLRGARAPRLAAHEIFGNNIYFSDPASLSRNELAE